VEKAPLTAILATSAAFMFVAGVAVGVLVTPWGYLIVGAGLLDLVMIRVFARQRSAASSNPYAREE
jgi:hypothetical protein